MNQNVPIQKIIRKISNFLEEKKEQQEYLLLKQETAQNILQKMPLEQELSVLADFFKVFGDAT